MDLSLYGSESYAPDDIKEGNKNLAAAGIIWVRDVQGKIETPKLYQHYYNNSGGIYILDTSIVDKWIKDETNDYDSSAPDWVDPPWPLILIHRQIAISSAVGVARGAGKNVKYARSTRWYTIAGIDQDYTTSLGRHQMSTSTTVIARPYPNGHTYLQYEQVAYFYDHYDFGPGEPEYGGRQREFSKLAHQAMLYGIAKPFEVQGESTPMSGFETR
ncbi:hypothetical protein [Corynebacterium provencense]|uniref:hypothetical protein n=1 Tax=Corynebacterium provencense TaxID=1737425 RepID=UPI0011CB0D2B|nr:hypothetical protein [Corynebacterium provencense]